MAIVVEHTHIMNQFELIANCFYRLQYLIAILSAKRRKKDESDALVWLSSV